jgi:hypothetical protein
MSCLSLFRRMRDEERTREARIVVDFIWEKPQPSICKRRERIIHSWTGRFWSRYTRSLKINVLMKIERERRRIMSLPRIAFWKAEQTRPCGYGPPFLNLKRKRREVSHSILEFELLLSHRSHWRVVVVSACKKSPERKEVM